MSRKRKKSAKLVDDDQSGDEIPPSKKSNLFSASVFRRNILGDEAETVSALKSFVHLCKSSEDRNVVLEYLEAGGGAMELAELIQTKNKKNIAYVELVFSALRYIIASTLKDAQQYRLSTVDACTQVLTHHLATLHDMLKMKSTPKHKKIALKLLAAMVTLSTQLAKMILNHVKIDSFSCPALVMHTEPVNKSVRTCFIYYLMAFLFDGNAAVVRPFLEAKGLLTSVVPGLLYDAADTVHLVLTTLQNKLLMNMSVSKTHRLHTFNTRVIKSLLMLYNWKGPAKWKSSRKARDNIQNADEDDDVEKEGDKQFVVNAVHEFLQVLCTSHKYGIIFHDKSIGTSGKMRNELLQSVLSNWEKPWEHEKPGELVLKIVTACPDMLKCILINMEPYLEPRVSIKWLKTIRFGKQIIESMNAELSVKQYADNLSMKQVTEVIHTLTMPTTFVRAIGAGMLQHRQMLVRHEAVNLLIAMLKQFHSFLTAVEQWNLVDDNVIKGFKHRIMKQLPNTDSLLSLWKMIHSPPEESDNEGEDKHELSVIDEPSVSSHMLSVIDLLILYDKCFPQVLDIPESVNFLTDIENVIESENDEEVVTLLQVGILQLLINVDSSAFAPDKELFSDALHRLCRLVDNPSAKLQMRARNLLGVILVNTGLFEGVLSEVCVWLHCCVAVPTNHREAVVKLMVDAFVRVDHCPATYVDLITHLEDDTRQVLDSSGLDCILDELLEMSDDEDKPQDVNPVLPAATVALSPLLPAVIEVMTSLNDTDQLENIKYFISCVVIHLLHSQTSPAVLLSLLERWSETLPSAVTSYIKGWTSDEQPHPLKKPFGSHSPESKISKALLNPDGTSVHHILGLDDENKVLTPEKKLSTLNKEMYLRDPIRVLLLYKLSVFHMVQLASRGELTVELRDKCKDALLSLLQVVSNIDSNQDSEMNFAFSKHQEHLMLHCLKYTFTNPRLIQLFTPLHRKKQIIEKLTTELVSELIKLSSLSKKDLVSISGFLKPFKQKLIQHIIRTLKNQDHSKISSSNAQNVISLVDLFELSYSEIMRLMDHIVKLPVTALTLESDGCVSLSVWGILLGQLLGRCRALHKPIKTTMVANITEMLENMTKEEKIDILVLEEQFLLYLELFPHHLKEIAEEGPVDALLLQKEPSMYAIKLVELLLKRRTDLVKYFLSLTKINKHLRKNSSVLFPVMCVALASETKVDDGLLSKLYNTHSEQIKAAILEPSQALECFRDYPSVVVTLVDKGMEFSTCKDIIEKVKKKVVKLPKYEKFYIDVVKCITRKVSEKEPSHTNIVLLLLEMLTSLPKENGLDEKQITHLCRELQDCAVHNKDDCVVVSSSDVWPSFFKMALKFGLQPHQDKGGMLLETLSKLCDVVCEKKVQESQVRKIFEWTSSHSEFLTIMLGASQKKVKLVELLLILVRKDPSVMSNKHVPIFLSSYNASLNVTDQLVLQLLHIYEAGGMNLHNYQPYLWGEAAINHYSVKSKVGMSLWRQPNPNHVLELLERCHVESTITNFPIDRGLELSQHATPDSQKVIYDPAFLLPLFNHLLAPEAVTRAGFFISCGGLALTLASLGSNCKDTRAAAYQVIARLYFHIQAMTIKIKALYLQFLDVIRNGVVALDKPANAQLPCVATTFLARASLVLSETHGVMFIPLQRFMVAKPDLDLTVVPEFFTFFHSSEVDYRIHRQWILKVIRDGFRSKLDFLASQRCAVFKLLMTFYSSVLADNETRVLILEVIESTVKIPFAAETLVSLNGLISWLHSIIGQLSQDDGTLIKKVINILTSLWTALSNSLKGGERNHFPQHTLLLLLELLPKLSSLLPVSDLKQYLYAVGTVVLFKDRKTISGLISKAQMLELLQLSKGILGSVLDCEDLLEYGCLFSVRKTQDAVSGDNSEQARIYLRKLVIAWLVRMYDGKPMT